MPGKDDPLSQTRPWEDERFGVTLFLEGSTMSKARQAFLERARELDSGVDERTWNTAWMAAVAAISYVLEGRTKPK